MEKGEGSLFGQDLLKLLVTPQEGVSKGSEGSCYGAHWVRNPSIGWSPYPMVNLHRVPSPPQACNHEIRVPSHLFECSSGQACPFNSMGLTKVVEHCIQLLFVSPINFEWSSSVRV